MNSPRGSFTKCMQININIKFYASQYEHRQFEHVGSSTSPTPHIHAHISPPIYSPNIYFLSAATAGKKRFSSARLTLDTRTLTLNTTGANRLDLNPKRPIHFQSTTTGLFRDLSISLCSPPPRVPLF